MYSALFYPWQPSFLVVCDIKLVVGDILEINAVTISIVYLQEKETFVTETQARQGTGLL